MPIRQKKLAPGGPPEDFSIEGIVEIRYNEATQKKTKQRIFLLTWEGNKVPRGTNILGRVIAWTQHGIVREKGGKKIGMYNRLVIFGGDSGYLQKMIIYVTAPR